MVKAMLRKSLRSVTALILKTAELCDSADYWCAENPVVRVSGIA